MSDTEITNVLHIRRALVFTFIAWTGWDSWRGILPFAWQARTIAKMMLSAKSKSWNWKGIDPAKQQLVIQAPFGSYRIVDKKGRVARCTPEILP